MFKTMNINIIAVDKIEEVIEQSLVSSSFELKESVLSAQGR